MEKIKAQASAKVEFSINFVLTKTEAKALDGLAGYGADAFLKVFYEKLGKAYLQPHEAGLRSLFERIMKELPAEVKKIETAQKAISNSLKDF